MSLFSITAVIITLRMQPLMPSYIKVISFIYSDSPFVEDSPLFFIWLFLDSRVKKRFFFMNYLLSLSSVLQTMLNKLTNSLQILTDFFQNYFLFRIPANPMYSSKHYINDLNKSDLLFLFSYFYMGLSFFITPSILFLDWLKVY